jgi:membrane protease YdiL (CAAX protease family)
MLHPLGVALLSIGCGYLRERTGSLWASILLHAINNSLVIVGLVLGL